MHSRIGFILKLPSKKPAVSHGQFSGFCQHAGTLQRGGCQHYLGSKKTHELAAFHAETFRHNNNQRVAFLGTDHGQSDTGIATGGFDYSLSWFKLSTGLGVFDYPQCQPVFYGTRRIECFQLYIEVDVFRRKFVDAHDRSVANGAQNIFKFVFHFQLLSINKCLQIHILA